MATRALVQSTLSAVVVFALAHNGSAQDANLLALGAGALPVVEPPSYGGWPAVNLLDDDPSSGWASEEGATTGNVFVFELPAAATLSTFEFDTAGIDTDGAGARDILVEVSPASVTSGFKPVLRASLADRADRQRFPAQAEVEGLFVRLTIAGNHGDAGWTELMSFRGYGRTATPTAVGDLSGTYDTDYSLFHLRQQGALLVGCYEYNEGLFTGTVEGRIATLTWRESGASSGPAIFVFAPDGRGFRGHWWHDTDRGRPPSGAWDGRRVSAEVGGCPHWSGSVSGELRRELLAEGRARLYGVLFDTDRATIRPESAATLDEVVALLAAEPSWRLAVEGHTDATGSAAHNQVLSEQRAAAVRDYLVSKGVAAERLTAAGFGAGQPVADNGTELGRARNRRVELVRLSP